MDNKLSTKHAYTDEHSIPPVTSIKDMLVASVSPQNPAFGAEIIASEEILIS